MNRYPAFVAVGEALTDLLRTGPNSWHSQVGGSTWNVARVVAKLGGHSAFAGSVSCDLFGQQLVAASTAAGLDPRFLQQVDRAPLLAVVHETNPPRYFFIGENSADLYFDVNALPEAWHADAQWVHFGGISLTRQPLAGRLIELALQLKALGVRISYDPNFRSLMDGSYDVTLERMTGIADLIKVSDEDLRGLFRCSDEVSALASLRQLNPDATILLTEGARGACLHWHSSRWRAPAPHIEVADSVGAGDTCMGAFLYSLMSMPSRHWGDHLRFAVAAGAAACTKAGAIPPGLDEIDALMLITELTA